MMRAAVEHVSRQGLRAVLELPMEEVIAAADVPRAAAYRLWPSREKFTADVLDRLAEGQTIPTLGLTEIASVVQEVEAKTAGGAGALDVACTLMALAVESEFDLLTTSDAWRAFLAFEAAVASIPDAERRRHLLRRLSEAEAQNGTRLAGLYRGVAEALGLRPSSDEALLDAAHAARVLARGLVSEAVREGSTESEQAASRRCLGTATAALIRDVFVPVGDGSLPRDWPQAVLTAIQSRTAAPRPPAESSG
ncbi:hypothetical protein [Thermobifida halotolerans]|uniref:hypothetical protein n=1 Tax=Thermobifida halotolerans TaxID=483545 RepID=UPI0018FEBC8C|nr:hypothetical protein [Thermobifida halotolerans]